MIVGRIERANSERCSGWAFDSRDKERSVQVRILVNGDLVGQSPAANRRPDVQKAHGALNSGFILPIAAFLKPGKNVIKVFAGADEAFQEIGSAVVDTRRPGDFVEEGIEGWLFLQNDSNDVISMITGQNPLSPDLLAATLDTLGKRAALAEAGLPLATYVVPDKGVVCNHFRRVPLSLSDARPALQIQRGASSFPPATFHYGLDDFAAHPQRDSLFWRTDTHFSELGKALVFDRIRAFLGHATPLEWGDARQEEFLGDLGVKLRPRRTEVVTLRRPLYLTQVLMDEVSVTLARGGDLRERRIYHRSDRSDGSRIAIFGTSSAYHLRELFFATFEHVHFYWRNGLDLGCLRRPDPDYVVAIVNERFLGSGLQDERGKTAPLLPTAAERGSRLGALLRRRGGREDLG